MANDGIDQIQGVLDEISNRLYDNIIGSDKNAFISSVSLSTKERMVKDNIMKWVRGFFEKLNKEFEDVHFQGKWILINSLTQELNPYHRESYGQHYLEEEDDFDHLYDLDPAESLFYNHDLREINLIIHYIWERKCNLGCTHRIKRFMIINIPKVLDFTGWINTGMPVKTFVKEFIPDFFYDPMQPPAKRGRPKKASGN